VKGADEFVYVDPVDQSFSSGQGLRVLFHDGSRIVTRLSGTGTVGATLRLYFEAVETDPDRLNLNPREVLAPLITLSGEVMELPARTGMTAPTVET
jgi:phosphoglucomutase